MSIVTGKYFDIPIHEGGYNHYEYGAAPTKMSKRIFFQSGLDIYNDDNEIESIINARTSISNGFGNGIHDLGGLMERGGRSLQEHLEEGDDEVEGEEYEDDVAMSDS